MPMHGDNTPEWVLIVRDALKRGTADYRLVADTIAAAMAADPSLTQAMVGEFVGHKAPWVNSVLKWRREGYPPEGVFAAEIAKRRAKLRHDISTSKLPEEDQPWLPGIDGSPTDAPPLTEVRALRRVMEATSTCEMLAITLQGLGRSEMLLACKWEADGHRIALTKLRPALEKATVLAGLALSEAKAALQTPRKLDDKAA